MRTSLLLYIYITEKNSILCKFDFGVWAIICLVKRFTKQMISIFKFNFKKFHEIWPTRIWSNFNDFISKRCTFVLILNCLVMLSKVPSNRITISIHQRRLKRKFLFYYITSTICILFLCAPCRNFNVFSNLIPYISSSSRVAAMQCHKKPSNNCLIL